jgi:phosphopantetheinyl transferase (holo-ACP synthase)
MSDNTQTAVPRHALEIWLAATSDDEFDLSILTPEEHSRYCRLRSPRKRNEFALSRTLLRRLAPTAKAVSISHSRGYAAVATSPLGTSIGIDLEVHKPRDVISLARFAFHPDEARALSQRSNALELFYELWVLKEACAKALGLQLVDALRDCVFCIEDGIVSGTLPVSAPWHAYVWRVRHDASLGAVIVGSERRLAIQQIEWPAGLPVDWLQTVTVAGGVATPL